MGKVTYVNTPDRVDQVEIRVSHGVRLVSEAEEGTGVNALPGGVYAEHIKQFPGDRYLQAAPAKAGGGDGAALGNGQTKVTAKKTTKKAPAKK